MSKVTTQLDDTFDVDSLRLPSGIAAPLTRRKSQRFGPGQKFLRGPIPWDWLSGAARLPGKALQVGLAIWHLAGLKNAMTVELSRVPLESLGVTRQGDSGSAEYSAAQQLVYLLRANTGHTDGEIATWEICHNSSSRA